MDITFRAARYDESGKKTAGARVVSIVMNDTPIQKDVERFRYQLRTWQSMKPVMTGVLFFMMVVVFPVLMVF